MPWPFRRRSQSVATDDAPQMPDAPYAWLGNRRHLADAPYVLPSDDSEMNRLDFQHYMLRYALRGNYAAPLDRPTSILDVGGGTGRWAMEMATLFPQTNVICADLITPKVDVNANPGNGLDKRPDNYAFVQANVLDGLPFADGSFDYVHVRLLLFAIPAARWPQVAREVIRVTRPGGWVESVETGPQLNGGPAMDMLVRWIIEASNRRGVDSLFGPRVAGIFQQEGLANMAAHSISLPVGRYGGRLGALASTDVMGVVGGIKQLVVAQGIATETEYDAAMAAARADLDRFRCELPFYIAYGQRP